MFCSYHMIKMLPLQPVRQTRGPEATPLTLATKDITLKKSKQDTMIIYYSISFLKISLKLTVHKHQNLLFKFLRRRFNEKKYCCSYVKLYPFSPIVAPTFHWGSWFKQTWVYTTWGCFHTSFFFWSICFWNDF